MERLPFELSIYRLFWGYYNTLAQTCLLLISLTLADHIYWRIFELVQLYLIRRIAPVKKSRYIVK
jgi:hypothetical protein